jgi:transposase
MRASLAILYRAGARTTIHMPSEQEEAARELLRCREDIRDDLLRARHRLSKFLLRHGRRFTATKKAWTKRHAAWLQAQRWPLAALEQTHRAYVRAVDEAPGRLQAVDTELRDLLTIEPLRTRVERLRCFRGIDDLTALTIAAELGDARRFPSAPRVMAFTGLVPSEHSSGAKLARGAITKTGNAHLRRVPRKASQVSRPLAVGRRRSAARSPRSPCRLRDQAPRVLCQPAAPRELRATPTPCRPSYSTQASGHFSSNGHDDGRPHKGWLRRRSFWACATGDRIRRLRPHCGSRAQTARRWRRRS